MTFDDFIGLAAHDSINGGSGRFYVEEDEGPCPECGASVCDIDHDQEIADYWRELAEAKGTAAHDNE